MKKYKKIVSLILSLTMMASVSLPAYASENVKTVNNVNVEDQIQDEDKEEPEQPEIPEQPETQEGTFVEDENGIRYVYDDGTYVVSEFVVIEDETYYFDNEGYMVKEWKYIEHNWYYFDENGHMETGWVEIDSPLYYFHEDGHMAVSEYIGDDYVNSAGVWSIDEWRQDERGWWYKLKEGGYAVGWKYISENWYFFNHYGYMKTGWENLDGSWYYFDETGAMVSGGWMYNNDKWYYFDESGVMATGWVYVNGKWYLANSSGAFLTGLAKSGDSFYYLESDCSMRRNSSLYMFGKTLSIDNEGVVDMQGCGFIVTEAMNILDKVGWNLRAAYNWSAGLRYYRMADNVPEGWYRADWYAHYGFANDCGNCRVMACTLYYMTQLMGYESHYVEGVVPRRGGGWAPHGWLEIVHSNGTYVYDPNFENETGMNGYHITYGAGGTWRYSNYHRVN